MKTKAINFFQGKICMRNENGTFEFMDYSYVEELKQQIDKYIYNNPTIFNSKDIIFTALKDLFGISKTFVPPDSKNFVPSSDPLYNELLHYVYNNPVYSKRLNKKKLINFERKKAYDENRDRDIDYYYYKKYKEECFRKERIIYGKRG